MNLRLSALALGLAFSTAISGIVLAADVETTTGHDWTGLYVGGHVGYGSLNVDGVYDESDDFDLKDSGLLGGFQAGFNWQIDNIVLGIEGDVSYVDRKDETITDDDELISFDTDYLMSLRARAGYAFDNMLVYATAGAAWTDTNYYVNDHIDDDAPDEFGDIDLDGVGFVFGGGGEYALDERWSVRAEALYYVFDDKEDADDLTHDSGDADFVELNDVFVIRAGVNFHF